MPGEICSQGRKCTLLHFSPTNKTRPSEITPWCPESNVDDISSFYLYQSFTPKAHESFMVYLLARELLVSRMRQVMWMGNQIWHYSLSFLTFCKEKKCLWLSFYGFMYDILSLNLTWYWVLFLVEKKKKREKYVREAYMGAALCSEGCLNAVLVNGEDWNPQNHNRL